jgi:release factor glutamine methyltransferase
LSILSELKKSNGIGIDISKSAIDVAEKNKNKLKIKNATFLNISWNEIFSFLERKEINIDVIVSNPPYIRTADIDFLDDSVKNFDPHIALDGGKDGLSAYKEICYVAKNILRKNQKRTEEKYIFLEVGYDQAEYVKNILEENEFFNIAFSRDLSGINRVVIARII